jgi:hypothetical protein
MNFWNKAGLVAKVIACAAVAGAASVMCERYINQLINGK